MMNYLRNRPDAVGSVEGFLKAIGSSIWIIIMAVCLFVVYCVYVAIVHFGIGGL